MMTPDTFGQAMDGLWMAFQPVVRVGEHRVFGYEALLRSDEPFLSTPREILYAAEERGRVHDVGRAVRARVAAAAFQAPEGMRLLMNLHSADVSDEELFLPAAPLSKIAERVVLELGERASPASVARLSDRVGKLKDLGFQIAIDGLTASDAELRLLGKLAPDIAKLDMSLVRAIDGDPGRQSIVRAMTDQCHELGILVVAEGVETLGERDKLAELGCDLQQGFLFGRPDRRFRQVRP